MVSGFGAKAKGLRNDGINIAAKRGAPVIASENGVVAYAGNELRGFGNLLLIKTNNPLLSVKRAFAPGPLFRQTASACPKQSSVGL